MRSYFLRSKTKARMYISLSLRRVHNNGHDLHSRSHVIVRDTYLLDSTCIRLPRYRTLNSTRLHNEA